MISGVGNNAALMHLHTQRREKVAAEKESQSDRLQQQGEWDVDPSQSTEDETSAAVRQKLSDAMDEMSSAFVQFRRRREYEKRAGAAESGFDRVLEEDLHAGVTQLITLVKGSQSIDIEHLLHQIRAIFPDDSDLVLVLRELLYRGELDESRHKKVQQLLNYVEKMADPRRLKAGINIALKARLFGQVLNMKPGLLRESYRNFLESENHEVLIYQEWITHYGAKHRTAVTEFMERALLADIDALDPSCSHREFGDLLMKMGQIKLLRSSEQLFIQVLLTHPLIQQMEMNKIENRWLFFMLNLLQQPIFLDEYIRELFNQAEKQYGVVEKATALQIIYRACKQLPESLFIDETEKDLMEEQFAQQAEEINKLEKREQRRKAESAE